MGGRTLTGSYPFTTIEPNHGVTFYPVRARGERTRDESAADRSAPPASIGSSSAGALQTECPCKRFNKTEQCLPRSGRCVDGTRYVPVKMIDVAGLVPGASEGAVGGSRMRPAAVPHAAVADALRRRDVKGRPRTQGLGNQFLDDLRHADALIHVVDVSGTTNAKGETTVGYDPINDIDWLRSEIHTCVRAASGRRHRPRWS